MSLAAVPMDPVAAKLVQTPDPPLHPVAARCKKRHAHRQAASIFTCEGS
jgi:hypothetical protein